MTAFEVRQQIEALEGTDKRDFVLGFMQREQSPVHVSMAALVYYDSATPFDLDFDGEILGGIEPKTVAGAALDRIAALTGVAG